MKKIYEAPDFEQFTVVVEHGFETSDPLWYEGGGTGNFNYTTDTDETWG